MQYYDLGYANSNFENYLGILGRSKVLFLEVQKVHVDSVRP